MSNNYFFLSIFFFTAIFVQAQNTAEKVINGIIVSDSSSVEGVHILNLVNEKSTVSDRNGKFSITAKEDDLLVFSAIHLEYARKSVLKNEYSSGTLTVKLTSKVSQLDEVVVTEYPRINAQELGIINYKPKEYTPAERKLRPAIMTKNDWLGIIGGKIPVDPFLYWVTGRTKTLKGELEIEKKELLLKKLEEWNENNYYVAELKIPADFVDGFKYCVIYDEEMIRCLTTNNKLQGNFQLAKLSVDYLNYLKENE
jgi:hypothetical protein